MDTLITLGQAFLYRGIWSWVGLANDMLTALRKASTPPLKAHIVLVCQSREFAMNGEDINAAIALLYEDETPEWDLEGYWLAEPGELQDFYDNFKMASDLNNDEKQDWVKQTLWLAECFLNQFNEMVPFLTDEFIEAILDAGPTSPKLRMALSLMRRLIQAYSVKSDDAIRGAQSELSKVHTKTFVELLVCTMTPLYRYGSQLKDATDALGNECHDLDMEYLANTLYKVMGSNVPFCGAAGMLCRRVDDERTERRNTTVGVGVGSGLVAFVCWPIAILGLIAAAVGKFGQEVDLLGSCCKIYILLVVTRAGSFFDGGTPQYESYEQLLRDLYNIDVGSEDFRMDDLLKSKGLEIFQKVDATRLMVQKHGKDYGVETSMGD
ncbi:hypothetical protein CEP54_002560 [Fusarium duplospermum]|uniref:Uncharacterized protein n=1 Tax=Fusarium duplospermum TaxID=1325734 RepID=A0A428QUI0_9HYPO|nr:hypothetical protein CEP54_002560 [Fusarium duplospermum]